MALRRLTHLPLASDNTNPDKWVASSAIKDFSKCPHMLIETEPVGPVSYDGMASKYCFSAKAVKSWKVTTIF
jgi:hypothetical protein